MLSSILNGREKSNFILLEDSSDCSGWDLFFALVNNLSKNYDHVHIFLFEKFPKIFKESLLPETAKQNRVIHDFCTDPLGWINSTSPNFIDSKFSFVKVIQECNESGGSHAIVIDSISAVLRYLSIQNFSFNIQDLNQFFNRHQSSHTVLGLFHHDFCDPIVNECLEYLADSTLDISKDSFDLGGSSKRKALAKNEKLCKIIHKKQTGKITESVESFTILHGNVIDIKEWNPEFEYKDISGNKTTTLENSDDPTANLTFNLNLSSEEKSARSKLVMPYTAKSRHLEVGFFVSTGKC